MADSELHDAVWGSCAFVPFRAESRADRFDAELREGVWLGLDSRTDENIIGTSYGTCRAATIKGVPEDKRWDSARVLTVIGVPWHSPRMLTRRTVPERRNPEAADADIIPKDPEMSESIGRKMYIRKADIIK